MNTTGDGKMSDAAAAAVANLRSAALAHAKPSLIVLFGSQARGDTHADSDVDLLLVQDRADWQEPSRAAETARIRWLADTGVVPVDLLLFTPEEVAKWRTARNHLITHALAEGVVLYERP